LPRPIIIPDVMELETLADVRSLVEKHLPGRVPLEIHLAPACRPAQTRR
jgi:hypothetical protein